MSQFAANQFNPDAPIGSLDGVTMEPGTGIVPPSAQPLTLRKMVLTVFELPHKVFGFKGEGFQPLIKSIVFWLAVGLAVFFLRKKR